ncbi:unnamed protein product, partial [marine sediment metagenome]
MSLSTMRHVWAAMVSGLVFGMGASPAPAQCEWDKLISDDGESGDKFGASVSISGEYAIVGARFADAEQFGPVNAGAAYVFKRDGGSWSLEQRLAADDDAYDDRFGGSVSISGDYAIVGVEFDDDAGLTSGSAYIFRREGDTWVKDKKLTAEGHAAEFDHFGASVAIDGEYAVVGAPYDDDTENNSGSVFVFKRTG